MTRSLRAAKNVTTTIISQVLSWGLAFAVILFLPHYAGAAGLGKITLAGSFASVFGLLSYLGTNMVLMRDIPRDVPSAGRLLIGSLMVRVPLAIVGIFLGLTVGAFFGYGHQLLFLIGIGLLGVAVGVVGDTISSAIRGLEDFSIANAGSVIDKVVSSGLIILVCIYHGPLWYILAAPIVSSAVSSAYMVRGLNRSSIEWSIPDLSGLRSLVVSGLPFVSAGIFVAIYGKSDPIFLSKLSTIQAVGWYGLANRLAGTAMALPTIVCSAMLPPLSSLFRESRSGFIDGASRLINLMIICCIPISATMIFCPTPLVILLSHHTASFNQAIPVVRVYGVAVMFWFISQAAFTGIVACDQHKILASSMGIAALISVPITALSIVATNHAMHNGAVGAAISDLLVEAFLVACYCKALPHGVVASSMIGVTLRALAAAAPLIVVVNLVPTRYALISAVPTMAIYGLLCIQFKCVHPQDTALLSRLVGGKFGLK